MHCGLIKKGGLRPSTPPSPQWPIRLHLLGAANGTGQGAIRLISHECALGTPRNSEEVRQKTHKNGEHLAYPNTAVGYSAFVFIFCAYFKNGVCVCVLTRSNTAFG